MTSFSLDPTLWGPIVQFWTWVMADREIENLHSNKRLLDKTQSSKFCQLGVKRTPFQDLNKKRKWLFDRSTTLTPVTCCNDIALWQCVTFSTLVIFRNSILLDNLANLGFVYRVAWMQNLHFSKSRSNVGTFEVCLHKKSRDTTHESWRLRGQLKSIIRLAFVSPSLSLKLKIRHKTLQVLNPLSY